MEFLALDEPPRAPPIAPPIPPKEGVERAVLAPLPLAVKVEKEVRVPPPPPFPPAPPPPLVKVATGVIEVVRLELGVPVGPQGEDVEE